MEKPVENLIAIATHSQQTYAKNPRISRLRDLSGSVARDGSDWLAVALRYFYLAFALGAKVGLFA